MWRVFQTLLARALALGCIATAPAEPTKSQLMPLEPLIDVHSVTLDIDAFLKELLTKRGVDVDSVEEQIALDLATVGVSVRPDSAALSTAQRLPRLYLMGGVLGSGGACRTCTYSFQVELRELVTTERTMGYPFEGSTWHVRFDRSSELCDGVASLRNGVLSAAHSFVMACGSAKCQLIIEPRFAWPAGRRPAGCVYALDDAQGRKNRCVYIWPDSTWSLAEETAPGFFGFELARGRLGRFPDYIDGALYALRFPLNGLDGWRRVYVAGAVEVAYKGHPLPTKSED